MKNRKNKKIKKVTSKKKVAAKKTQKRKAVKKKNAGKQESVFGSFMPAKMSEEGIKILVKEEVAEDIPQPITQTVEETPVAELVEVVDSTNLNEGAVNEIDDYDDIANEFPIEESSENDNEYEVNEIEETMREGYLSDRQKSIIMYVAIASIMVIIVFFWGLSIKYSLSQNMQNASLNSPEETEDVKQIKESLNGIKEDFSTMSNYAKDQFNEALNFPDQAKDKIIENQIKDDVTAELQQKLNNLNTSVLNGNIIE